MSDVKPLSQAVESALRVPQHNRRKIYLINPRFQWRFIGFMAVVSLLGIAILFLSNLLFFRDMKQEALSVGLAPDNPYFDFLEEQKASLSKVYFGVSAVAFLVMMGLGILYSHRIAGPLHHLTNRMKEIADGAEPSAVSFRRKDQFQELAESFNAMLAKLKEPRRPV
jgi:methyl-accepting chemotaxis protein